MEKLVPKIYTCELRFMDKRLAPVKYTPLPGEVMGLVLSSLLPAVFEIPTAERFEAESTYTLPTLLNKKCTTDCLVATSKQSWLTALYPKGHCRRHTPPIE